jgi:hypothetical protein
LQITSTCLHHSQLEISPEAYTEAKNNQALNEEPRSFYVHRHGDAPSHKDKVRDNKVNDKNSCQKNSLKKSVSLSAQYKPTHNKSETGHKQKSCPLHKKKKMKDPETFTPFVSDHLIKTY